MRLLGFVLAIAYCAIPGVAQEFAERPLSNSDILTLSSAGISPRVIVAKILSAETDFDTSVETLVELSQAGVDTDVLQAMVASGDALGIFAGVAPHFQGTECTAAGIYIGVGDARELLEPENVVQVTDGGKFLPINRFIPDRQRVRVPGARSDVRSEDAQPRFLFCFEQPQAGLSSTTSQAVSPNEYVLIKLDVNKKKRQRSFDLREWNPWTGVARDGVRTKALQDVSYNRIGPGVYEVETSLEPGEYGFFFSQNGYEKIFTFGVD